MINMHMSTVVIMAINLRSHGDSIYNIGQDQDAHDNSHIMAINLKITW